MPRDRDVLIESSSKLKVLVDDGRVGTPYMTVLRNEFLPMILSRSEPCLPTRSQPTPPRSKPQTMSLPKLSEVAATSKKETLDIMSLVVSSAMKKSIHQGTGMGAGKREEPEAVGAAAVARLTRSKPGLSKAKALWRFAKTEVVSKCHPNMLRPKLSNLASDAILQGEDGDMIRVNCDKFDARYYQQAARVERIFAGLTPGLDTWMTPLDTMDTVVEDSQSAMASPSAASASTAAVEPSHKGRGPVNEKPRMRRRQGQAPMPLLRQQQVAQANPSGGGFHDALFALRCTRYVPPPRGRSQVERAREVLEHLEAEDKLAVVDTAHAPSRARVPERFDIYRSVWAPRMGWACCRDLYDTVDVELQRFNADWSRLLALGLTKVVLMFDDDGAADEDDDGVPDEVVEVSTVLYQNYSLVCLLFAFYASQGSGDDMDAMAYNEWASFVKQCKLVNKRSKFTRQQADLDLIFIDVDKKASKLKEQEALLSKGKGFVLDDRAKALSRVEFTLWMCVSLSLRWSTFDPLCLPPTLAPPLATPLSTH